MIQCRKETQLILIANPIKVLLAIICKIIGNDSFSGPLEVRPKQTKPKSTPDRVAIMMRFVFLMVTSCFNGY